MSSPFFPLDIAVHCRFGQMKLTGNLDDSALHLVDTGVHEIADDRSFFLPRHPFRRHPTALISLATMRGRISPTGVSMDSSVSSRGSLKIIGLLQFLQDKVKLCHSVHIAVDAQKPNDLSFMLDKNVDETKFLFLLRPL